MAQIAAVFHELFFFNQLGHVKMFLSYAKQFFFSSFSIFRSHDFIVSLMVLDQLMLPFD